MSAEPAAEQTALFCVGCFASDSPELGSSWGKDVVENHCMNCGAGGSTFSLPEWAIKSIRDQASWVGKRYYPHKEDIEAAKERELLRALVAHDSGRTAEYRSGEPEADREGYWIITQPTDNGWMSTTVQADTKEEALAKAKLRLPYRPLGNDNG